MKKTEKHMTSSLIQPLLEDANIKANGSRNTPFLNKPQTSIIKPEPKEFSFNDKKKGINQR